MIDFANNHASAASATSAANPLLNERLIPLNDAAGLLPRPGGKKISRISLWRWATKGLLSKTGEQVRLETIKIGQTRYTTIEAINRLAAMLDPRTFMERVRQIARTDRRRQAETKAAAALLTAEGFM